MKIDGKMRNKTLANKIQLYMKRTLHMAKWDLSYLQCWFNIQKSISSIALYTHTHKTLSQ